LGYLTPEEFREREKLHTGMPVVEVLNNADQSMKFQAALQKPKLGPS